jgi:hypothetical protein
MRAGTLPQAPGVRGWLRRLWAVSPSLTAVSLAQLLLLAGYAAGLAWDGRVVTGAPVWLKPAKFAASVLLYGPTLTWMLSHVEGRRRAVRWVGAVSAAGLALEMAVITVQAARGVRSHFNVSTPLDGALFAVMGVTILVVWLAGGAAALLLLRQRMEDGARAWGLRLGLLLSLAGAGLGGLMTQPSEAQVARMRQGLPAEAGAHGVGVADGGPGLPGVGWSTEGGDLRVPHFLGLHALQALPLLALALSRGRAARRLRPSQRTGLVWAGALAYGGLVALLTWQALRGEPLSAPGPQTLTALAAWATVSLGAAGLALWWGQRRDAPAQAAAARPAHP